MIIAENSPSSEKVLSWTEGALAFATSLPQDLRFQIVRNHLEWQTKEEDFRIWREIVNLLDGNLSDQSFRKRIQEIQVVALKSPIFQHLHNPKLTESSVHDGVTPFAHTLRVLSLAETDSFSAEEVEVIRFTHLFHDIGKLFGASSPYHAFLSGLLTELFLTEYDVDFHQKLIDELLVAIRYHHSFEEVSIKRIALEELSSRFRTRFAQQLFYLLSKADVGSVPYAHFHLLANQRRFQTIFPEVFRSLQLNGLTAWKHIHSYTQENPLKEQLLVSKRTTV